MSNLRLTIIVDCNGNHKKKSENNGQSNGICLIIRIFAKIFEDDRIFHRKQMETVAERDMETEEQFKLEMNKCREVFSKKLYDYGPSWRILRPQSVTDQILIKAKRIRSLEIKGTALVDEGIYPEFQAIVNYGIVGLIQLELGFVDVVDMTADEAMKHYDRYAETALQLMLKKNHDYDEAWRSMRISSYTDFILTKVNRTKEIEGHDGRTLVSEGIDANYLDMINYSVFGLIKLDE